MLKRNTNLIIKLVLIILLSLLVWFILSSVETEPVGTEELVNTEMVLVEPSLLPTPTPKPTPKPAPKPQPQDEVAQQVTEKDPTAKIKQWEEEHYYATKVWEYLMQKGFSQAAACGIIGNMMIETSGGSLDLKPNVYSSSGKYYGLCQWSKTYYPEAHGLSFKQQLEYLLDSIAWEINTFGKHYKKGFKYEDFLVMSDPVEAALAFAKSYERCRPVSYEMRQEAAIKAYEYFDLEYVY
jgi:hypothetical protein